MVALQWQRWGMSGKGGDGFLSFGSELRIAERRSDRPIGLNGGIDSHRSFFPLPVPLPFCLFEPSSTSLSSFAVRGVLLLQLDWASPAGRVAFQVVMQRNNFPGGKRASTPAQCCSSEEAQIASRMRSVQGKALKMPCEETMVRFKAKKLVGLPERKSGLRRAGNAQGAAKAASITTASDDDDRGVQVRGCFLPRMDLQWLSFLFSQNVSLLPTPLVQGSPTIAANSARKHRDELGMLSKDARNDVLAAIKWRTALGTGSW
jgi:hypothetical protein